jgi:hypothetical protein
VSLRLKKITTVKNSGFILKFIRNAISTSIAPTRLYRVADKKEPIAIAVVFVFYVALFPNMKQTIVQQCFSVNSL